MGVTSKIKCARDLMRRGHAITVICGGRPGERPLDGIRTRFITTRYLPFSSWVSLWRGVFRTLEGMEERPDILVTDFALLPPVITWSSRLERKGERRPKILLDVRSHPVEASRLRLLAQRARFAATLRAYRRRIDAITAVTEGLRDHTAQRAGVRPESIRVWSNGCAWCDQPTGSLPWPPELDGALRDRFVVIYQGSMTRGRGIFESVEAIGMAMGQAPELRLIFLGGGRSVPELKTLVRAMGLQEQVLFIDPVSHDRVPEFLAAADVGLVPLPQTPDMEINFPVKLPEYLCQGLPVILTDITPHRIVPAAAEFAFWAGSGRPEEIAAAMVDAYDRRSEIPELGESAGRWARANVGWASQFRIFEEVVESLGPREAVPA